MNVFKIVEEAKKRHAFTLAKQYQSFDSVKAMDQSVNAFLVVHGSLLTVGTVKVLEHLRRHSAKIPGVSFGKIQYIVNQTDLSESTVHRALNILEELGIIVRKPSETHGRRGANVVIIQLFKSPSRTDDEVRKETPENAGNPKQDVASEGVKCSRSVSKLIKLKDDIDYEKLNAKLDDRKFTDSALFKYGINSINLPALLLAQVHARMVTDLNWTDFMCDAASDIQLAIFRSCSRLMDYYRAGHRISSLGAYFVTIFLDQIQRQRIARMAS